MRHMNRFQASKSLLIVCFICGPVSGELCRYLALSFSAKSLKRMETFMKGTSDSLHRVVNAAPPSQSVFAGVPSHVAFISMKIILLAPTQQIWQSLLRFYIRKTNVCFSSTFLKYCGAICQTLFPLFSDLLLRVTN